MQDFEIMACLGHFPTFKIVTQNLVGGWLASRGSNSTCGENEERKLLAREEIVQGGGQGLKSYGYWSETLRNTCIKILVLWVRLEMFFTLKSKVFILKFKSLKSLKQHLTDMILTF